MDRTGGGVILAAVIAINLAILFAYKYYNFITALFCRAVSILSRKDVSLPRLAWALPVGISFYTFQAIGYAIDVWRGKVKAERNIISYALFVTFFPQLVAGPIERTENLLPQLKSLPRFDYGRAVSGLRLALWGMVKKVIISDYMLSPYVEKIYDLGRGASGMMLLTATLMFAVQIFCDFSGYTDIARGTARVLGYDLMKNFDAPYLSHSVTEFWRRWHISLSSWLRDYVYIPLGGNRKGKARGYINLMITFLVSGLWHGASWHFAAWGLLHGAVICAERMLGINAMGRISSTNSTTKEETFASEGTTAANKPRQNAPHLNAAESNSMLSAAGQGGITRAVMVCLTCIIVCALWIFFRAPSVLDALAIGRRIAHTPVEILHLCIALAAVVLLCTADLTKGNGTRGLDTQSAKDSGAGGARCFASLPRAARRALYYAGGMTLLCIMLLRDKAAPFVYFQF